MSAIEERAAMRGLDLSGLTPAQLTVVDALLTAHDRIDVLERDRDVLEKRQALANMALRRKVRPGESVVRFFDHVLIEAREALEASPERVDVLADEAGIS